MKSLIEAQELDRVIHKEWEYIEENRNQWSLLAGRQDMEVLEHVIRCILHLGHTDKYAADLKECVKFQNPDGGWAKISDSGKTSMWITTFVGLKLARVNLILKDPAIQASVDRALEFILSSQEKDGHWLDSEWSHLNTTCSATVFLTVYQVTFDKQKEQRINNSRKRGFEYIMGCHRDSGLWKDSYNPSGIETSAHLMQYTLIPAYCMDGIDYAEKTCLDAAESMIKEQAPNGGWDNENCDHAMDACRNLMLVSDVFKKRERFSPAIEKGVRWVIDNKNERGWGDYKGEPSHIERSGDGLDTLLKFKRYVTGAPMSHYWAYAK